MQYSDASDAKWRVETAMNARKHEKMARIVASLIRHHRRRAIDAVMSLLQPVN